MRDAPREVVPASRRPQLRRGKRLAAAMAVYLVLDVLVLYRLMSGSSSVLALIVEDGLELIAPMAFLITARVRTKPPTSRFPYGHHRVVTLGSFGASVALFTFGVVLALFSARSLLQGTHPTIGSMELFGDVVWRGWLVLAWLVPGTVVPLLLGRAMMGPSRALNNKVLYDTGRMLKADWQTSLAAAVGIVGIAGGWWWLDPVAAIFIAGSVVMDGLRNTVRTAGGLVDRMPTELGTDEVVGTVDDIRGVVESCDWADLVEIRLREEGMVYAGEVLVSPHGPVDVDDVEDLSGRIQNLDWRLPEVLVVPVAQTPDRTVTTPWT